MSDVNGTAEGAGGWTGGRGGVFLTFGVALPVVALVVESIWALNATSFFDPLPTHLHVLLVAFVAAANAGVWFAVSRRKLARMRTLALVNGVTIGIAAFYSVLF